MPESKPESTPGASAASGPPATPPPATTSAEPADPIAPLPLDTVSPQFTPRAVLTGMVLAALLSSCNIYTGLKIGWGLNMSITAALLGYGFWMTLHKLFAVRRWELLENNINQTACSSGASVSSAGLVAPIPALAMLTGQTLTWHYLALWVFSVCLVGITVAIGLRRQMLLVDKLPFVSGIASAETLKELYAKGSEAIQRVVALFGAALAAGPILWLQQMGGAVVGWAPPSPFPLGITIRGFSANSLSFGIDSSLLMYAVGALVGIRAATSILIGAIVAWGIMAPNLIHSRHLRLSVAEPLPYLPAGVELPPEPEGFASYDRNRRTLIFKGEMTDVERAALVARSDNPLYHEAVRKLYWRSQLERAVPTSGYTTTRLVRVSEPLDRLPRGFTIPRELQRHIRFEARRQRLVALGALPEGTVRELVDRVRSHVAAHPEEQPAADAALRALRRLEDRHETDFLPAPDVLPPELAGRVTLDADARTVQASGHLGPEHAAALLALVPRDDPHYDDYAETIGMLAAGSRLVPVQANYRDLITWLLWPGVTLMVVASLTSFAFSWRSILNTFIGRRAGGSNDAPTGHAAGEVPRNWFVAALVGALVLSVVLQVSFFAILWWAAIVGVLLTFLLAVVAGRVAGETNITPVGAMGKVTQLIFGALVPGSPAANLMAANVTGGSASQCADLLHDLKCGYLIGAAPRLQALAQISGALAGALAGSAVYLILIPHPNEQLITDEWAAPAVAAWKAVAELFQVGFRAIPAGTPVAMAIAAVAAVVLAVIEKVVPKKARPFMLSPASIGLAMVIHAHTGVTMFLGALIGLLVTRCFKSWSARFLVAICAGCIAGESITGVGIALVKIFGE